MIGEAKMAKAYTEILKILKYLPKEQRDMIPEEEITFFKKYCDKAHDFHIDKTKPIEDQVQLQETNALIVSLYRKYFIKPEKREMLDTILEQNEKINRLEEYGEMLEKE